MIGRRLRFLVIGVVLEVAAVVSTVIAPAAIAETQPMVVVSSDGVSWSSDLASPLFDPALVWVPGDTRTSSFFVKNRGPSAADVRIQVTTGGSDGLVGTGDVLLRARVADGRWQPVLREAGSVLNTIAVGVGEMQRIDVRAAFREESGNASQASGVVLRFVVRLEETATSPIDPERGPIPNTGAPALGLPLFLAALCIGIGLALVRRRPERRHG